MLWLFACATQTLSGGQPAELEGAPGDTGPDWTACTGPQAVRINEFLAANHHGLTDADGETNDWIELSATAKTDLEGWTLGDSKAHEWPLSGTLAENALELIWASGKNRTAPDIHTDFSISAFDAEIFLRAPEGCVADHLNAGRLFADTSFGRNSADIEGYFLTPTPGAPNITESRPGFAVTPSMTPEGGFHQNAVVSLSGANITYTLDGSVPSESSEAYAAPLDLDATAQPVVVRAVAFEPGLWPSRTATQTYFEDTTLTDNHVRVIALTANPGDLFDPETGIYEFGPPDYERWYPYFGANFWEVWERDIHIEYFGPEGDRQLDQDAGIQIAGGYSRAFDQRNFELIARSGYGPDDFAATVFHNETISSFARLYLRNGGDWCSTQLVDATVQSLFRNADGSRNALVDAQAYAPALVYINGEFWGLYELKERLDESYDAAHHDVDPAALDRIKVGWTHEANWELEQGTWDAFNALETLRLNGDLSSDDDFAAFDELVDLPNFAATQVVQGWIGNTDWWYNNIRMWRPTPDGEFRWMAYDFGHGFPDPNYDHLETTVNGSWMGLPIGDALENPEFRDLFVNVHADFLNTTFLDAAGNFDALAAEIRPVMPMQRARWCGGPDMAAFEQAAVAAHDFASRRAAVVEQDLHQHLLLGARVALSLTADPPEGGTFQLTAVSVESGFSGTYYEGVPIPLTAVPADGYTFAEWSDGEVDASRSVNANADVALTATFEPI